MKPQRLTGYPQEYEHKMKLEDKLYIAYHQEATLWKMEEKNLSKS